MLEEMEVPPVLLSGNHAEIRRWRLKQSLGRTGLEDLNFWKTWL
nr:tRNA (guanine-N(1)-)-methyltransferase [Klebsiella pneumoniae]